MTTMLSVKFASARYESSEFHMRLPRKMGTATPRQAVWLLVGGVEVLRKIVEIADVNPTCN